MECWTLRARRESTGMQLGVLPRQMLASPGMWLLPSQMTPAMLWPGACRALTSVAMKAPERGSSRRIPSQLCHVYALSSSHTGGAICQQ